VEGVIDPSREPRDPRMLLSDLFVPNGNAQQPLLVHRARALAALEADIFDLHLTLSPEVSVNDDRCPSPAEYQCPFCAELAGEDDTVFREFLQARLASRVVYEDDDFILVPPLGQFMQGGLLLLTREHIHSMAYLPPKTLSRLEQL